MKKITVSLIALWAFSPMLVPAQWAQTHLQPLSVLSMHARDDVFLAGTIAGTMRSTDDGQTWANCVQGVEPFWDTTDAFCLSSNSSFYFAGYYGTVYRSADQGITWSDTKLAANAEFYTINAITCQDSTVYAGTTCGLFRSTSNGAAWTQITNGISATQIVYALLITHSKIYAGTDNGVLLSADGGLSWSEAGLQGNSITSLAVSSRRIFASTPSGSLHYSPDGGATWTNLNFNENRRTAIYFLLVHEDELFVASRGIHKYGQDLNYLGPLGLENKYICNLLVRNGYLFAGTNNDGIWKMRLPQMIPGDLDLDGQVNVADWIVLTGFLAGQLTQGTPPFKAPLPAADLDRDGSVTAVDAVVLSLMLTQKFSSIFGTCGYAWAR